MAAVSSTIPNPTIVHQDILLSTDDSSATDKDIDSSSEEQHNATIDKPKVPIWRLVLLSTISGSVDMGYGIESGYAIPLIVAAGLKITYASLILTISPFVGVLINLYLGGVSDRCKCRWGRRRPFILFLGVTMIIGCIISPFSPMISNFDFDGAKTIGIALTGLGVIIFDLSLGQMQLPIRAYLLDVVPATQVNRGNFIMTILAGIGGFCGYGLGGINWAYLFNLQDNIVTEAQIFFMLGIVIIVLCLICTLLSVKEVPTDDDRQSNANCCCWSSCTCNVNSCFREFYTTLFESVKFVFYLSKEMWILWFAVFFGFVADFAVTIFFTTFVGEVIYNGDPSAPQDSELYHLYTQGVRTGSWGLAVSLLLMTVSMVVSDIATKYVEMKTVVLIVQYCSVMALFGLTLLNSVPAAIILVSFTGPYLGTLLTFPYVLIASYKVRTIICIFFSG